jgi:hypothetical protein
LLWSDEKRLEFAKRRSAAQSGPNTRALVPRRQGRPPKDGYADGLLILAVELLTSRDEISIAEACRRIGDPAPQRYKALMKKRHWRQMRDDFFWRIRADFGTPRYVSALEYSLGPNPTIY